MKALRRFITRFNACIFGQRQEDRLRQEIEEHLALQTEESIRAGLPPGEARRQAVLKFGSIEAIKDEYRDQRGLPFMETLLRDSRYSIRQLRKSPVFAVTAIAILALGIGANTAVYSVAKGVVFAPLPFPRPDRLALIFEADADELGKRFKPGDRNLSSVRPGTFQDWRQQSRSFESMAAVQNTQATMMEGGRAYVVEGFRVGDGFFETLGVPPLLGRYFTADDYAAGEEKIIVLAHRLWRERYNAEPSIVGRDIVLDGSAHRVIGIMPPGFLPTAYGNDPQFWTPLAWDAASRYSFFLWGYTTYARLKDGVTFARAQSEMDAIAVHMRAAHPSAFEGGAIVAPLRDYLFGGHDRLFTLLLVAVGLVLLIACANVANLLLARGLERRREFAVRSALGASRAAILRQVLAESLVIAIAGGLVGAALSPLLTRPVLLLLPAGNLPRLDQVRIDQDVLAFTVLISISAGLISGIAPAIQSGRGDLSLRLRAGGRGSSAARYERWLSDALMIAEIAFSLVLLASAGLLAGAFLRLLAADPGFRPERSVALQLSIPSYRYGAYEEGGKNLSRQALYRRLEESVRSLAGVQAAGLTRKLPILQFWNPDGFSIEGRPPVIRRGEPLMLKRWGIADHGMISYQTVSPGYFAVLRIPLIRGRMFDNRDRADSPFSAIINQAMARKFFRDENPIGRRIAVDRGTTFLRRMTIVGIVADARLDGLDRPALPEVFAAMAQLPSEDTWIVARANADTASLETALQKAVHDTDSEIGIKKTATMTAVIGDSLWRERLSALLVGVFAALATCIAGGGLYAVISHAVERRMQEMGIRLALGADRADIARAVLGHGFRVTAAGMALGTLLTLAATRLLAQRAFPVMDLPWIFAAVASLLAILTLAACCVPLRRALNVNPVAALRAE